MVKPADRLCSATSTSTSFQDEPGETRIKFLLESTYDVSVYTRMLGLSIAGLPYREVQILFKLHHANFLLNKCTQVFARDFNTIVLASAL